MNEITFGSSVFAGSVAMLKFLVGGKNAQAVLYDGTMHSAETAAQLGMIDKVSSTESLVKDARELSMRLAGKDAAAFRSIKNLLRTPVAEDMASTWQNLRGITIHS